ncbi:MAG: ABC transporter substrate-binding protein [Deltaproteobacteria bacterium]|nr:ABC transporter substrate-binding protein [Candidatus Tharpella sp.]
MKKILTLTLALIFSFTMIGSSLATETIKIGFNIPLTGEIPKVGESSKFSAEMLKADINGQGGLQVGDKKYKLEFVYEDNESKAESAVAVAQKLIDRNKVLAIIGPNSSKQAVPAGEICDLNETVMVSPWSTNPDTTLVQCII